MRTPRAILIAGPTASGKSALAVAIAARRGGVVINADSMQVYRDLEILSARPSAPELAQASHLLYGFVPASEPYSVGRWIADVAAALADTERAGALPVIVGGTGLYFKALLEGLSPIPAIPADIRAHWRGEARRLGAAALHALLAARDPQTARGLRPSDPQRVTRALEVLDATGRGLATWQLEPGRPLIEEAAALKLVLAPDRDELYQRADLRFDAMMAAGALEEARRLGTLGLSPELPVMRALGVRPLLAAASGDTTLEAAIAAAKLETRNYIKRQLTWLKRNMITWTHVNTQETDSSVKNIFTLI